MKKKWMLLCFIAVIFAFVGSLNIYAADTVTVTSIYAIYTQGEAILVGQEIDTENVIVTAYFSDGTSDVVTNYNISSRKVLKVNENIFTVVYQGKSATFTVIGKNVKEISALYTGENELSIGNKVSAKNITVNVTYTDGSVATITEGFNLTQAEITKTGANTITVVYENQRATFEVTGRVAPEIDSITAVSNVTTKSVGTAYTTDDILVTAIYKNSSVSSEIIYNFTISPATVRSVGLNKVTVTYRGKSEIVDITGVEKQVVSITASYSGGDVVVGKSVRTGDILVTATYSDGTKGTETEFTLLNGGKVGSIGSNLITVDVLGAKAEFYVNGIAATESDFTSAPRYDITNGKRNGVFAIDLPVGYTSEDFSMKSLDSSLVKRILSRELRSGDYIPFEVIFIDTDLDVEVPLVAQITIPSEYELDGCEVYYTPNRKTVLGCLNTDKIGTDVIQITIFSEGTYILTYDPDWKEKLSESN